VFHSRFKSKSTLAFMAVITISIVGLFMAGDATQQASEAATPKKYPTLHKTIKVDGLDIFYREAGPKNAPTILLLHGFPTSSQMFRNLIPALSDRFHTVAPDYPGFGNSSMPPVDQFEYTFDNLAEVMDKFTQKLALNSPPCPIRSAWPSPSRLSLLTRTRPWTGSLKMPVRTVFPLDVISLGRDTLTDKSFIT